MKLLRMCCFVHKFIKKEHDILDDVDIQQILKKSSYSEKGLFRAYCKIADIQEKMFYFLKEKLEKDYEFIIEYAEHCANDDEDLKDYIETFCDEYNEMEDCLDVFDDVLEYEYEDDFEEKVEKYADKKSELEDELSDIEDLKDELEMLIY